MKKLLALSVPALFILSSLISLAGERSEIPEKYKWKIADLYPTADACQASLTKTAGRIPELVQMKGNLSKSAQSLRKTLDLMVGISKEAARLRLYTSMLYDQDTRVSKSLEMKQSVEQMMVSLSSACSYIRPGILAMSRDQVDAFIREDPGLKDYEIFLHDILRMKEHTLSPDGEKLVSEALGQMGGSPESIYDVFKNADLPYPEITLESGGKIRLDVAAYTKYRAVNNPEERRKVFKAFFGKYAEYERTIGTILYSGVKAHVFNRDARKYRSSLAASLDGSNIPEAVYRQLITDVHDNLKTLHRYLRLRQKMLGLPRIGYEDLYTSLVKNYEMQFTPEEAMDLVLKSCEPLGKNYTDGLKLGFQNRWTDFIPSTGKKPGAYSDDGAYDVHPYQLLNFMGEYDDVSTLAHECGHTMHSYLSNRNQPYVNAQYSTFVAEVASTLNEDLLMDYMMKNVATNNEQRLYLLGTRLETFRTTLFRQTMFAEFELKIHEMVESSQTLTGELLTKTYLELLRKYYGHDEGICSIDALYGVEWAYVPHFYYNFYVFQYSTSLVASSALANRIKEEMRSGSSSTRDAYLKLLSSGGSKYPIDLLKDTGIDMTTSTPFKAAIKEINGIMDQIETILKTTPN